jgi:hypothetical protein
MEVQVLHSEGPAVPEVDVREASAWETHGWVAMMDPFATCTHPKKTHIN